MSLYDEDHRDYTLPSGDYRDDAFVDPFVSHAPLPSTALCLKVPGTHGEELVVHRENDRDYVFLFESLDDAFDYARDAEKALQFTPEISRVSLRDLHFASARYKPALSEPIDLVLRRY